MIKMKDSRLLPSSHDICDYIRIKQKMNNVTIPYGIDLSFDF